MKKILIKSLIIYIVLIACFTTKSFATGTFSISASKTTIDKGESVTLSITGTNAYGGIRITATNATVSPNLVFLQNDTKTVTITSNSTEDIVVTASISDAGLGDIDENPIEEGPKQLIIKVNKQNTNQGGSTTEQPNPNPDGNTNQGGQTTTQEKSKIATLSNLGIKPNDFKGFNPNIYTYTTEVPNDVDKIEVYAYKGHSGQTISGTGANKTLKVGENKFDVTVTAEDGKTTKTYTINVIREEAEVKPNEEEPNEKEPDEEPNEKPEEPEEAEEAFGLSELTIEGLKLKPQFKTDVYEYTLELKEDLKKLNITALSTHADTNIEIAGNENLVEGENIITIVVKTVDEENGKYNKIAAYQIVVNKVLPKNVDVDNSEQNEMEKIVIISTAGGTILIIILIILALRIKKTKKIYEEDYEIYNDSEDYENKSIEEDISVENKADDNEFYEEIKKIKTKGKRFK